MTTENNAAQERRYESYEALGYWEPLSLGEHLRNWADAFGERVALVEAGREVTYVQLNSRVDTLAAGFVSLGIQKGDAVVVQLPNSIAFAETLFALFRIGALAIMAMPAHREAELDGIFSLAEPVAHIVPERFLGFEYRAMGERLRQRHPSLKHLIVDGEAGDLSRIMSRFKAEPMDLEPPSHRDTALLLLSGGTTGTPKLIPRTHADYAFNAKASASRCRLDHRSVYMAVLPVAHNFPLSCPGMLGTLSAGGKVVFCRTTSFDEAFPLIEKEKVTITALVPAIVTLWLQALEWDTTDLSSLQLLQVGGSPLDESIARRIGPEMNCRLQQVFGMAEGLVCYTNPDDDEGAVCTTQGMPLCAHDEVRIVDDGGRELPPGGVGELLVRGPYTIAGYYRAPEVNRLSFTPDGFYRSGDQARLMPDGAIQVRGRIKEQVNRAGEKIMASEVESLLISHPEIEDAAVVALPDDHLGERSCAFVLSGARTVTLKEIHAFFAEKGVARFKMPDQLEFVSAWPLTSVGKVDKKTLARTVLEKGSSPRRAYHEETMAFDGDSLMTAAQLVEAFPGKEHLLYEENMAWSLGLGVHARLVVDSRKCVLTSGGETLVFMNTDLSDTLDAALGSIAVEGWRAYGTADFELARHNLSLWVPDQDKALMTLFIPEAEVRFQKETILLRALDPGMLDTLKLRLEALLNRDQALCLKTDLHQRVARQALDLPDINTHDSQTYRKIVACAVEEIRAPQYQKVILSRKIPLTHSIDMVASYVAGRRANTPARSYLLHIDGFRAAGFSPETVVEVDETGVVSTQPLAGTRAIGADPAEEIKLREELLSDSKEISEHAISIKLAFEEMETVCRAETISVTDFMTVARRGTVQHLASRLKGTLKDGFTPWHAFNALFPAVTASGIPKRESIDSIGRFESQPRGLYSGCVIICDQSGYLDAALVLRSFFQKDGEAWLQAGAGIVEMSTPSRELEETCEKLRSVSRQLIPA
ncbi:salicylate synthase [Desulfoluna spongiiphila]|uniref:salicylate synthase n=1 Tax=Desulfoluna spongiiphila TaxID=419481 RepID=UPI00125A82FE|nr:salicylate synthase [Desulfoluna spongiiphila]VVS94552.1 adc synthase [Desulfoluna spongiiphila]